MSGRTLEEEVRAMAVAGDVDRARQAYERGDWPEAYDVWARADLAGLPAADLDDLATASELLGHHDTTVLALQQEFRLHEQADDSRGAVHTAFRLAMSCATHGEPALFSGWSARAQALLPDVGADSAEAGWVAFLRMFGHLDRGEIPQASQQADLATEAGRRNRDPDLVAMGLTGQGRLRLYTGRIPDGLACLDEAMVRVIAGECTPIIAGHVYCTAIEGCQEISDFGRVAEWASALERWCSAQPGLLLFTGQCALHRGQLFRVHGDWAQALDELALAAQRYVDVGSPDAIGLTARESGDVLRLRGDLDEADLAYQRASDHGCDPQPGLALLWLARGQDAAALAAVERMLAEEVGAVARCRVLPAAVEVLLASGQVDRARSAADELSALACSEALTAMAAECSGAVELAADDPAGALPFLRKAGQLWARASAPYDASRAGVLRGRALARLGDDAASRRELEAARDCFRRLGARPAADLVSALLAPVASPAGLTPREVEVLRLVATGRTNPQIAAELVLSEKTVARHLSNIFTKLDVASRTAAAAYAYEHGLM
ncbi:LuxR family transcriptional regulator [uncultured Nocardioides sp.]|uniref:helix-turn-helix transcriptional regulator n=1 Tax=uncultured Nocardioides sp. TaxID=198441 RepID=UPI002612F4A7|nr:LuxR family transcriptional regulator [uncultured Nocardioides sp.]